MPHTEPEAKFAAGGPAVQFDVILQCTHFWEGRANFLFCFESLCSAVIEMPALSLFHTKHTPWFRN